MKVWMVAVTVKLTVVVCVAPPVPLAVPVMIMFWAPVGRAMLANVEMVKVTGVELLRTTLAGLKLQVAPVGRPVQLLELKVMLGEPLTGVSVRVATADCPAGTGLGVNGDVTARLKSAGVTVTVTTGDVDDSLIPL